MTGHVHWLPIVIVIAVAVAAVAFWAVDVRAWRKYVTRKRHITCPATKKEVDVELVEDPVTHRFVGVRACTRFSPADVVTCKQFCKDDLRPADAPYQRVAKA